MKTIRWEESGLSSVGKNDVRVDGEYWRLTKHPALGHVFVY